MKKQQMLKVMCSVMLVGAFAFMSLASSSTSSDNTAQNNGDGATNATTVNNGGETEQAATTTTTQALKNSSFEISYSNVKTKKDSLKQDCYFAIVEITNTGETRLAINEIPFDFEDDNKNYLMTANELYCNAFPSILNPNEKGYICCYGTIYDDTSVKKGVNIITDNITCSVIDDSFEYDTDFKVASTKVKKNYFGDPKITGRITNNMDNTGMFNIYAVLYNKKGKLIGVVHQSLVSVDAGESKGFSLTELNITPFVKKKDVHHYDIYAVEALDDLDMMFDKGEKIHATPKN